MEATATPTFTPTPIRKATAAPTATPALATPTPTFMPTPFPRAATGPSLSRCVTPPANLVAWWPLDETGGTTAHDIVGGHHGTHVNGPTPTTGKVASALAFDGVDDYVDVADDPAFYFHSGALTVDAWILAEPGPDKPYHGIVWKRGSFTGGNGFSLHLGTGGTLTFAVEYPGGSSLVAGSPDLRDGRWHHVTGTWESGGQMALYLDGVQLNSMSVPSASIATTGPLRLGTASLNPLPETTFKGRIDEVELFDRALTAAEIQAIYRAGA